MKNQKRREAYEWARRHHNMLIKEKSGRANAYSRGYSHPDADWPTEWNSYPFFAAGRDNRRAADRLPAEGTR